MQVITLQLPLEAVQSLLHVLGQLPSSSGVYPLMADIQRQGKEQLDQQAEEAARAKYAPKPEAKETSDENA
jgi:hypothetical protein